MKAPSFQFYADDFIGGTCAMTPAEVGAYLRLLCYQWGQGAIPQDDPEKLARIAGCQVSQDVLIKFTDGKNEKMERVRAERQAYMEKQAANGRLGGRPSKPKSNPNETQAYPKPNPTPNPNETSPVSGLRSPSLDSISKAIHLDPSSASPMEIGIAEQIYAFYPRKVGKVAALKAIRAACKAKPPAEIQSAVMAYAAAVAVWPAQDRQFIPHPATWFSRGSYDDDPAAWARDGGKTPPRPNDSISRALGEKHANAF